MERKKTILRHYQPAIISVVAFIFLLVATVSYTNYKKGLWEKDVRASLLDVLIGKKSKLEKALYSRIYYTRGVAAFVALKPDISTEEFYELAKEYIQKDTVISTMALSKNCVLSAIYPLEGHEAAIGLDLLAHPERKEIVEKTIETHQTFVAGPVELVEGGIAFISYTPIFDKSSKSTTQFWGVTDIVIKEQSLLNEAHFIPTDDKYRFALRGYNGAGENGAVFWGEENVFSGNPVTIHIDLPIGSWILAGAPISGWNEFPDQDKAISFILLVSSLIISILIWLFSRAALKIRQNEKDLKAIFWSMDNIIVEFSSRGEYLKIAPTNNSILYRPEKELLGKTVHEIFEKENADLFLNSIQECIMTKKLVVIEYSLEINGENLWFSARINYKSDNSVIYNAFDITKRKLNEQIIHDSAKSLKQLNQMKDKFFSIIAHDLRNPVGGMKSLTDLIIEQYDSIEDKDLKEFLRSLQSSSSNLYLLLEDLLSWSRTQTGKIVVKKQIIRFYEFCDNLVYLFETSAGLKSISIKNKIAKSTTLYADYDLLAAILRNLISNAIKFTNIGGKISISLEEVIVDQNRFQKISVTDNGVGISEIELESLFKIDNTRSTSGTNNEKGSGLGLLLCKELIEIQDGSISVSSKRGKGSTLSILIPANGDAV